MRSSLFNDPLKDPRVSLLETYRATAALALETLALAFMRRDPLPLRPRSLLHHCPQEWRRTLLQPVLICRHGQIPWGERSRCFAAP